MKGKKQCILHCRTTYVFIEGRQRIFYKKTEKFAKFDASYELVNLRASSSRLEVQVFKFSSLQAPQVWNFKFSSLQVHKFLKFGSSSFQVYKFTSSASLEVQELK